MGARKVEEQSVRSLTENSTGTHSISLPISLVRQLRWKRGRKLVVRKQGKKLVIEDWQP